MDDSREELERRAFPVLDEGQIEALRRFGEERETAAGDVLFRAGDAVYPLVVVLGGRTQIRDCADEGEHVIEDSGRGEIHGELAMPGVFAVGDVRSGAVQRVASAVGEGSVVVQAVHAYLAGATHR